MITTRIEDRVSVVTLDHSARRNALGSAMVRGLQDALHAANHDRSVGAVVLTGSSGTFCAGSDMKELASMDPAGMAGHEADTAAVLRRLPLLDKPVIAAVEGYAMGGGFLLASACDIVVAARTSVWLMAEVPNGWLSPWGLYFLVARVGPVAARRLSLGHQRLDGVAIEQIGIADYLADSGTALESAMTHAHAIAALPPAALRSTKAFFAPAVIGRGEYLDAVASAAFLENCRHAEAQATLAKFGGRHG